MPTLQNQATLYRKDPRYYQNGIVGTKLNADDAYVDTDDIPLSRMFETTEFKIRAKESRDPGGKAALPLAAPLNYEFLESNGFLFPILSIDQDDTDKNILHLILKFDPQQIYQDFIPLYAVHQGKGEFKLGRNYEYEMKNPFGLRGNNNPTERLFQFQPYKKDNKLLAKRTDIEFSKEELVKVLVNWDPNAVSYVKNS